MTKVNFALILLVFSVFASNVYAEAALENSAQVEGNWKLDYTKPSMTSKETIKREDTWMFKGGKATISHIPRQGTYFDQPPVDYKVEDGKLKISLLGRPNKFEIFSLVEVDDSHLTLKSKYGDIYYFKKK
ncbi:MAG: hypothetical protein V3U75_10720 [Methylococcaceae bacterium]